MHSGAPQAGHSGAEMSNKIRLLFVDDEVDFVQYARKRLERRDLEVVSYTDPTEAFEKTRDQTFDVALLDLRMPGLDGEELLKRLKARDPLMEIIILTAYGSIETAFRTSREGAYAFLQKPCDFDALVRSICEAYSKRIKALHEEERERVDSLMLRALDMSPLDLLRELKRIGDGLSRAIVASAMAEGGDHEGARELLHKPDEDSDGEDP